MNVLATIVSETPGSNVPLDDVVGSIGRFTEPVIGLPRRRDLTAGSGEKPDLHPCFQRAFQIEQRVQQNGEQDRAAARADPAEKQPDDENL